MGPRSRQAPWAHGSEHPLTRRPTAILHDRVLGRNPLPRKENWLDPISDALHAAGLTARDARARATMLVSGLRGLALDRYLTGDRQRTDDAARSLIATTTATTNTDRPQQEMVVRQGRSRVSTRS